MDSLARADAFFAVTTVAIILIAALLGGVLIYALRILRDARKMSKKISDEAERVIEDVGTLRTAVKEEGLRMRDFADSLAAKLAFAAGSKIINRRKKKKDKEHAEEEKA